MTDTDLALLSATEMVAAFADGSLSPVETTQAALDRIEDLDSRFNAFCHLDRAGAIKAAREAEMRWRKKSPLGPVDGVSVTVKDLVLAKGWPIRRGSLTTSAERPRKTRPPSPGSESPAPS